MTETNKCPYCPGKGRKIAGRVTSQSSHLAFGWGQRVYQCKNCKATWVMCYSIPPKAGRNDMPQPREGILRLSFIDGVRGYASPLVLKCSAPVPEAIFVQITETPDKSQKKEQSL